MADTTPDAGPPHTQPTYLQRLKSGEQHVLWKLSLRLAIIILNLIAIGTAAWTLAQALPFNVNPYIGYFDGPTVAPWILIVACISLLWCLVCILVVLLRRPPRPAHPGIAVGVDLILWLAFIVTGLFTVVAVLEAARWGRERGQGRGIEDPSYSSDYSGEYYLAPNNTWMYNVTSTYPSYAATSSASTYYSGDYFYNYTRNDWQLNSTRSNPPTTNDNDDNAATRDCSDYFPSCAAQDAYINTLWHTRHARLRNIAAACAAQWLNVLLHFALFVWACVDVHRRRRARTEGKAIEVAERVMREMQARGLVMAGTGEAGPRAAEVVPLMGSGGGGGGSVSRGVSASRGSGGDGVAGPSAGR